MGGHEHQDVAACRLTADVQSTTKAEVFRGDVHDVGPCGFADCHAGVGRARIDQHHLLGLAGLRRNTGIERRQMVRFVERPNND